MVARKCSEKVELWKKSHHLHYFKAQKKSIQSHLKQSHITQSMKGSEGLVQLRGNSRLIAPFSGHLCSDKSKRSPSKGQVSRAYASHIQVCSARFAHLSSARTTRTILVRITNLIRVASWVLGTRKIRQAFVAGVRNLRPYRGPFQLASSSITMLSKLDSSTWRGLSWRNRLIRIAAL